MSEKREITRWMVNCHRIVMESNPVTKLTEEQYLEIERKAEFKSEFLDGVMYAMSGGSLPHAILERNIQW